MKMAQWRRTHLPVQELQERWVQSLGREDPLEAEMAPIQYSSWDNPTGRRAGQTTVHGVTKRQTQLSHTASSVLHAYHMLCAARCTHLSLSSFFVFIGIYFIGV